MKLKITLSFLAMLLISLQCLMAQNYSPIVITGFNQDVIAETGTSSLTTTTMALDGIIVSNKVIYSNAFRIANGFAGGGVADNGTIVNGTSTYQLAAYSANNALLLPRSQSGDLTLPTPAKYAALRLLAFSTEASSQINVTLFFTDGTSLQVLTNYTLGDWFNGTTNLVLSGFGRCNRATPASGAEAFSTNPRLYYIDLPVSCANRQKDLQKISITNATTAGSNAPYPNAVFFALSGVDYSQNIVPTVTNASCSSAGSASLAITGSTSPYTISWNTTPVQTGATATNLTAGSYTATITDAGSCVSTFPVTITSTNNLTMTAHIDTTVCPGSSFNANTISNAANYSWTAVPAATAGISNTAIANPLLTPTATTVYTVTGTTGSNCSIVKSFTVSVAAAITLTPHIDTTICPGSSFNANTISNASSFTWTAVPAATAGISNTGIASPILAPTATTVYTITATTGNCSTVKSFTVNVATPITLTAHVDTSICAGASFSANTISNAAGFTWTALPANTAGISNPNIANPILMPTAPFTTYSIKATTGNCSVSKSFNVTVFNGVNANAGPDVTIFQGASTILQGAGSAGTYLWTPPAGLSSTNTLTTTATPTITTPYTLTITSAQGCVGTDNVTVFVLPFCINPMNAVTPNGDGINDKWLLTSGGNCTTLIKVSVYNRYGSLVYNSSNYANDWQGTYKGKPIPDGTYYYVAEYFLIDGRKFTRKGDVTILR